MPISCGYVFYKFPFLKDAAVFIFTTQIWRGQLARDFISTGAIYVSVQLLPVVQYHVCFAAGDFRKLIRVSKFSYRITV